MSLAQSQSSRESLAAYVTGTTLELGAASEQTLSGATLIDRDAGASYEALPDHEAESVDAIVSWWGAEHAQDTVAALSEWRRVLREGGTLALVIRDGTDESSWAAAPHAFTSKSIQNAIRYAGGFEVVRVAQLEDDASWLIVAERRTVLDLRNILGIQGGILADAAQRSDEHRAELCFQFGTILLRAGEIELAQACFNTTLGRDPDNAESVFGLGMCYALAKMWQEAIPTLQRAIELDPNNSEAKRWLGFAQLEVDADSGGAKGGPQGALS